MRAASLTVLLLVLTLAGTWAPAEAQIADESEPAAAGLARDLIGEPEGRRLTGDELDRVTLEVSSLMRCPVCQGLSVADSPTTSALAMREEARDLLASGYTEEQVLAYFERSYGEFIRLSPKPVGFNLVVWILPVVALAAGALLLTAGSRRRGRRAAGSEGSGSVGSKAAKAGAEAGKEAARSRADGVPDELAAYAERVRREVKE